MSPENVEVVQAAYRAFNDTDEEALLNLAADGLVVESDMYLDEGPFYGRDAVSVYGEALREAFGDSARSRPRGDHRAWRPCLGHGTHQCHGQDQWRGDRRSQRPRLDHPRRKDRPTSGVSDPR
jgi:hypothetical protein